MLDRFDIILDIEELSADQLLDNSRAEPSAPIQGRILAAREKMAGRRISPDMPLVNARLSPDQLDRQMAISAAALELLKKALDQQKLSARAYHKILRVAASIRDLAVAEEIDTLHMAEAISYRLRPLQA
jgi:magnesium chelatase family protein